jgi:uncharacterized protein (TIGR03118 family)
MLKPGETVNAGLKARTSLLIIAIGLFHFAKAGAQNNNYRQVNLVSDVPGLGLKLDPGLANPWGVALTTSQPFRIANNETGKFKSYDATGAQHVFEGDIAVAAGDASHPSPTGVAANPTSLFVPRGSLASPFLFATEDGTISGEYADERGNILQTTILVIDNSARGAVYTGLAVLSPECCAPFLAAADFHGGFIEAFTGTFDPLSPPGTFTDPNLPPGYAPYNLAVIGNQVFVAYARQDMAKRAPVVGAGNGIVDVFDLAGTFVRRFASNGSLNAPWGIARASANFGPFSNDILIGNTGDGIINAFDPATGEFLGALKDGNGNVIVNLALHGLVFGEGNTGDPDMLYFTAGMAGGLNGVFGAVSVNTGGGAPDFSLTAAPRSVTVVAGQSARFSLTATPIAEFRGVFSFTCTAPTGVTCSVGTSSVDTSTGAAKVTVTTTTPDTGISAQVAAGFAFPSFLLGGFGLFVRKLRGGKEKRNQSTKIIFGFPALACVAIGLAGMAGCGSGKPMQQSTGDTASIAVTATSGSVSHSMVLTVTVQ